ncbi:hypothetical protein FZ983_16555 [Azospirillum sp. B21]|uniref:hypothetical protein n=1 Tax=Azospirillum sp. B21 TaxID=2607496 RepID=UPI0011F06A97|nr:hypothetical protein [Azospirillum sp. B21]KAA0578943.1 hypothetical protein FZ983_16555 [Azospirillum sp. B21]
MCDSFAIVTRGIVRAGNAVKAIAEGFSDIDSAKPALDRIHDLIAGAKRSGDDILNIDSAAIGFSKEIGDFVAYRWEMKEDQTSVNFSSFPRGMHLAPVMHGATLPPLPPELSDEQIVKIALAQHTTVKRMGFSSVCIGGEMHLTELTRTGIVQRTIGQYPDYAEMRDTIPTLKD